jgi:hypothetical protein
MKMYDKDSELANIVKQVCAGERGVDSFIALLIAQINARQNAMASDSVARDSVATGKGRK